MAFRLRKMFFLSVMLAIVFPFAGIPAVVFHLKSRRAIDAGDRGAAFRWERAAAYVLAGGGIFLGAALVVGTPALLGVELGGHETPSTAAAAAAVASDETVDGSTLLEAIKESSESEGFAELMMVRVNQGVIQKPVPCFAKISEVDEKTFKDNPESFADFLFHNRLQTKTDC